MKILIQFLTGIEHFSDGVFSMYIYTNFLQRSVQKQLETVEYLISENIQSQWLASELTNSHEQINVTLIMKIDLHLGH